MCTCVVKNDISVSIILPCFNVADFVERAYNSISQQTLTAWEAIFIDDGSTDSTYNKLLEIANGDRRIKIIQQKNLGSGEARNTGVSVSKGKFLYFMDPDDELKKYTFEKLLKIAEEANAEITICGYEEVDLIHKNTKNFFFSKCLNIRDNKGVKDVYPYLVSNKIFNPSWNKLYSKEFWLKNNLKFPAVKKGQDALLNMIAFKALKKLAIIPDRLYVYYIGRMGSAQTKLSNKDFKYFEINQKYEKELLRHWRMDYKQCYIERLIAFSFADSVKVYRFVNNYDGGIKEFLKIWKKRKAYLTIRNIRYNTVLKNKKVLLKLLSMRIPIINYFINYYLSNN